MQRRKTRERDRRRERRLDERLLSQDERKIETKGRKARKKAPSLLHWRIHSSQRDCEGLEKSQGGRSTKKERKEQKRERESLLRDRFTVSSFRKDVKTFKKEEKEEKMMCLFLRKVSSLQASLASEED